MITTILSIFLFSFQSFDFKELTYIENDSLMVISCSKSEMTYHRSSNSFLIDIVQIRKRNLVINVEIKDDSIYNLHDSLLKNIIELNFIRENGTLLGQKAFWSKFRLLKFSTKSYLNGSIKSNIVDIKKEKGMIKVKFRIKEINRGKYRSLVGYDLKTGKYQMFLKLKLPNGKYIKSNKLNLVIKRG